jgi:hypothetical protein
VLNGRGLEKKLARGEKKKERGRAKKKLSIFHEREMKRMKGRRRST